MSNEKVLFSSSVLPPSSTSYWIFSPTRILIWIRPSGERSSWFDCALIILHNQNGIVSKRRLFAILPKRVHLFVGHVPELKRSIIQFSMVLRVCHHSRRQ